MIKILLYAAAIYLAIRVGRLLLTARSALKPTRKNIRKVYDDKNVRDAEYTDIEENHE